MARQSWRFLSFRAWLLMLVLVLMRGRGLNEWMNEKERPLEEGSFWLGGDFLGGWIFWWLWEQWEGSRKLLVRVHGLHSSFHVGISILCSLAHPNLADPWLPAVDAEIAIKKGRAPVGCKFPQNCYGEDGISPLFFCSSLRNLPTELVISLAVLEQRNRQLVR